MHLERIIRRGFTLLLLAGTASAPGAFAAPALTGPANVSQSADEKRACMKNLRVIYEAIQAYQIDQRDLPNWLSDLVPKYLEDPNVLVCPVCRRTGQTESSTLADPKLPSSYLFEFCPVPLGNVVTNAPSRTRREWKRRQMGLVGSQVPIVRCRYHKPVLNLAFDGKIYESPSSWELLFTNRVNASDLSAAKMFADVRPSGATKKKKAPTTPRFAARNPAARKELLDLTRFYNAGLNESRNGDKSYSLSAIPTGVHEFGGVDFDVRGVIQLGSRSPYSTNYPASVQGIPVHQQCQRLHFLHAAAFGNVEEEGKQIGTYLVRFAGNQAPVKIPIRYGYEVRDCRAPADELPAPAELTVAWQGPEAAGKTNGPLRRLFLTTWTNSAPEADIEAIDFVSGVAVAAPFVVAITAD